MNHCRRSCGWAAVFFVIVYVCASFLFLDRIEKKINPINWDLETYSEIQNLEDQMVKRAGK